MPHAHAPTEPMLPLAARPPAARPPVAEQVAEIAPLIEAAFVRADDNYDFGGATADTAPQAAEAFARPKARAPEPLLPEPPARVAANIAPAVAAPAPVAAPEPPRAAQPMAAAPAPAAPPAHATPAAPAPIAAPAAPAAPATPASTEAAAAEPARDRKTTADELTEPFETIDDVTLSAIADDLRKYPEVEWACELSDGSELPVIGVRIEPSYLARAPEIEAHVRNAAREHGTRLLVLLLTENATTKQARAVGRMFFPWKKKR